MFVLSDPLDNIEKEIYLEKIKNFFNKYKIIIISAITLIILSTLGILVYYDYKDKEIEVCLPK